jgi:hypothetical protein
MARLGAHGALTVGQFILPLGAVAAICLLGVPIFLKLGKDAGDSISGRVHIGAESE